MEKKVDERDLGVNFGPFSPNKMMKRSPLYDFYSEDARFWQQQNPILSPLAGVRMFPFTTSQWQELQRQALIYKHLMASVPVPPDLLHPSAARSFPENPSTVYLPATAPASSLLSLRFGSRGGMDAEPGRCKRTDGKKWRCARDAAPDQKYCERHLHRGRPRSRKPVEQRSIRNTGGNNNRSKTANASSTAAAASNPPLQSMDSGRQTGWSDQLDSKRQWETMQLYEELPNLNYSGANESWRPSLNSNLLSLDETSSIAAGEPPRRFIDAWSSENNVTLPTMNSHDHHHESSVIRKNKLPLSTLSLSMPNTDEDAADDGTESQPLNWLAPCSPLGGPLAEVLQSSTLTSPRNSGCADLIDLMRGGRCGSDQDRDSPSGMVLSSPSGILHKALVSLSDSSSSDSPTFAAASRADFALRWMNLSR